MPAPLRRPQCPWQEYTLVLVFSTKGMSALAHSRGLIDYDERIAAYWPQFAQNSKETSARLATIIVRLVEDEGVVSREGYKVPARYTHEELGSMIGSNRTTVTRALSRLRKAGLLEVLQRTTDGWGRPVGRSFKSATAPGP